MIERNLPRTRELSPLVSSLGLACLSLLGGCASESGGGGGGGAGTGPLAVTSQNAETLARAAITVATVGDSLPFSASHFGNAGGQIDCAPGTLDISASTGSSSDTITTPSGNVISPPPAGDTVLDYDACLEGGYTNSGRASVSSAGGGSRVRWMNLRVDHSMIVTSNVVGAAIYDNASDIIYRIDDLTVTQGSDAFYAIGQIDSFSFSRALRFDVQLRFPAGSAQVTTPQRLTGVQGMHFDGGRMLIEGDGSSVTVLPQGSGVYRLEIDTNGDDVADTVLDGVSL